MAQEEEQQRCSNSNSGGGGGGKISKKVKTKKIPQRGLGVAQLEKIILEEQQTKDTSVFVPSLLPHNHQSSSPVSTIFPQSCSTINNVSASSSTSLFRSQPSIPCSNFDLYIPQPPPPPPPLPQPTSLSKTNTFYGYPLPEVSENGGSSYSSSAIGVSCEFDLDGRNVDPNRFTIGSHTNTIWPSINIQQQSKYQQHQPPFSRVNVSLPTSSSSGLNIQMEPPSNQSLYNYGASQMWPEEDKMVAMKRPWPFATDNPPFSSFPYKLPHFGPQIYRLDESSSRVNGRMFNFEPGNTIFREGPSTSAPPLLVERRRSSFELNPMKVSTKEAGLLERDFLTLGPPPTNSSLTPSKAKHPLVFPVPPYQEFAEFDIPPFQIYNEEEHHQPPYSFFPPKRQHVSNIVSKSKDQRGEVGDNLDLNLRL